MQEVLLGSITRNLLDRVPIHYLCEVITGVKKYACYLVGIDYACRNHDLITFYALFTDMSNL